MGKNKRKQRPQDGADEIPAQKKSKVLDNRKTGVLHQTKPFVDSPTGDERKREAALYELLASEDPEDRINAANTTIECLIGGAGAPGGAVARHLEQRLFRGLASGRKAARLGYGIVITEILSQLFGEKKLADSKYPDLTFEKVLSMLMEKTQPAGNISKVEARDHYWGRLFGLQCFFNAEILHSDPARWFSVLNLLLKLPEKKAWMWSQCGFAIVKSLRSLDQKTTEATMKKLEENKLAETAEGVGIWITAFELVPDLKISKPWKHPLTEETIKSANNLTEVLVGNAQQPSEDDKDGSQAPQQNWSPQLHWIWDVILDHFVKNGKSAKKTFSKFWTKVVEGGFFVKSATPHQKYSGLLVFRKMLEGGAECQFIIDKIFSKNVMSVLMTQAEKEERYLHFVALKAVKAVEIAVEKNPSCLPSVLRSLVTTFGTPNFDERTRTKTVAKILRFTSPDNVDEVLEILESTRKTAESESYPLNLATYYSQLVGVVSAQDVSGDRKKQHSVSGQALKTLADLAYDKEISSDNMREQLHGKFSSAAAKFVRTTDDLLYLQEAITRIDPKRAMAGVTDEFYSTIIRPVYDRMTELVKSSKKKSEPFPEARKGLAILHAVGLLQIYSQDPDAADLLEELRECSEKLKSKDPEEEGGMSEFLVEVILGMFARPSSLVREVSQRIFAGFAPLMTPGAMQLLTEPLEAAENAEGHRTLFSGEDEEGDVDKDDGSEDDGMEIDSDVEVIDAESDDDNDGAEDTDEDDSDDGDEDDESPADAELEKALAAALNDQKANLDEDADSDSDMSDSEMMQLDEKLAEIFKHRAKASSKKKDERDAKEAVIKFKHRVLDLLAVFIKQEASSLNPLVLDLILPLLVLVRRTKEKSLSEKAVGIVLSFSETLKKAKTSIADSELSHDDVLKLLGDIHQEAGRDDSKAHARAASSTSLAITSVLLSMDNKEVREGVFATYSKSQLAWYEGEAKMHASFFSDWLSWCQTAAKKHAVST